MLPPFIIEQIRQREEKKDREEHRPRLELPLDRYPAPRRVPDNEGDDPNRGVIILDLG